MNHRAERVRAAHAVLTACCVMGASDASRLPGRERVILHLRRRGVLRAGSPDPWKLAMPLLRDHMGVLATHASRATVLLDGWTCGALLDELDVWMRAMRPARDDDAPESDAPDAPESDAPGARRDERRGDGTSRSRSRKQTFPRRAKLV